MSRVMSVAGCWQRREEIRAEARGISRVEKRTKQLKKKRKEKGNAKRQAVENAKRQAVESYEADERAALAIQRRVRRNQEANRLRAAIVSVQAAQRGRSVRESQSKLREAITELQAAQRGAESRAEFESLKQQIAELESMRQAAATTVQSAVRGQQARRQQQALEGIVTKLQAMVRGRQGRAASDIPQTFSGDQQMTDSEEYQSGADTDIDDEEFATQSEEEFAQQLASVEPEGFSNGTQANGPGTATNAQQPEAPLPDVTPEEADDMYRKLDKKLAFTRKRQLLRSKKKFARWPLWPKKNYRKNWMRGNLNCRRSREI
jgi:hypothetical protein